VQEVVADAPLFDEYALAFGDDIQEYRRKCICQKLGEDHEKIMNKANWLVICDTGRIGPLRYKDNVGRVDSRKHCF
jgi:hypothetical protein